MVGARGGGICEEVQCPVSFYLFHQTVSRDDEGYEVLVRTFPLTCTHVDVLRGRSGSFPSKLSFGSQSLGGTSIFPLKPCMLN